MQNCEFCRIANKESSAYIVEETKHFLAFLDINPLTEGHTLIIPKKHYENLWDIPFKNYDGSGLVDYFEFTRKVAKLLQQKFGGNQPVNTMSLGYEVRHSSIHLIPNVYNGFGLMHGNFLKSRKQKPLTSAEAYRILKKLGSVN